MKTKIFVTALLGFFALTSCTKSDDLNNNDGTSLTILEVENDGTSGMRSSNIAPVLDVTEPLTVEEIEFIYAIREDEKVSRDLYLEFATMYPEAAQIGKIAKAESSHIACVEALLNFYEITYPALSENGVFEDETRQTRYNELLKKGATLVEALSTMALIEEESVFAYTSVQAEITNVNISLVIENMIKASSNHLRATVRQLTAKGGSYAPSFLTTEAFDAIINTEFKGGKAYKHKKGNGNKNGNKEEKTHKEKGGKEQGDKNEINTSGDCTGKCDGTSEEKPNDKLGKKYRGGK